MIALILGGAPSVWRELAEAEALLNRRHMVVAANLAGIHHAGHLDAWCSLHPDLLPDWAADRAGEPAGRLFSPPEPDERWPGSSGLYAVQCALFEMGATAAILCGVPMEQTAGHFSVPGAWASTADYRRAFETALPELGGRVRSMGGWTADVFGQPSAAWIAAVDNIKPLGVTRPQNPRTDHMHHVKNVSETTQRFHTVDAEGLPATATLEPGAYGDFEINTAQAAFQTGDLKVTAPRAPSEPKAKAAPAKKAVTPRVRKPAKAKPAATASELTPPASDEA